MKNSHGTGEKASQLLNCLEAQEGVYSELAFLAEQQREALVARQPDALIEIAAMQEKSLADLRRVKRDGEGALKSLTAEMGSDASMSLSQVAERLPAEIAAPLREARDRISRAAERLTRLGRINMELFESAQEITRFTLQLLAKGSAPASPCYAFHDSPRRDAALLMDRRA